MSCCPTAVPCCQGWALPYGERQPLRIDWSPWIESAPGFSGINEIVTCELTDLNTGMIPPPPADPVEIALVSGYEVPPAVHNPGFARIINGTIVEVLVEAGFDTRLVMRNYRLDMRVKANDCDGRRIVASDCVVITIIQCYQ